MSVLRSGAVAVLVGLTGCGQKTDLRWRLPADGTVIVHETRSTITRTPLGLEEVKLDAKSVWRVIAPGVAGTQEIGWTEQVTAWNIALEGAHGQYAWTLESEEPLLARLGYLQPPPLRSVWVGTDGTMSVQLAPEDQNAAAQAAPTPRGTFDDVPAWVSGLVRAPPEPVRVGAQWSWTHVTPVTTASRASATTRWEFTRMLGTQAQLDATIELAATAPPASGSFRATALSGGGQLRLNTLTGFPMKYTESYDADIASPSARGTALRRLTIDFEVL